MPETVEPKPYCKKDLFNLLVQAENLQHNRVYFFLVAETLFFLAAGTVLGVPFVVIILSISGLFVTLFFTVVNLRNAWRVRWLMDRYRAIDPLDTLYDDYVCFKELDTTGFDKLSRWCAKKLIHSKSQKGLIWYSTIFIFTWGLFFICGFGWLGFLGYGIWEITRCCR